MNKTKFRYLTILALVAALALVLGFAFGSFPIGRRASAVTYRPSELFSAGTAGTSVGASDGEETSYVQFTVADEGKVHFRRDLALKWFAPATPAEDGSAPASAYETEYFAMTFAFAPAAVEKTTASKTCPRCSRQADLDAETCPNCSFDFTNAYLFDRYEIVFESAEENISKEGTSTNSLVFFYEDGTLKVAVRDSYSQPDEDTKAEDDDWYAARADKHPVSLEGEDITVSFTDDGAGAGEFVVFVNGTEVGVFTNIGGNFMEYLSSASSTPRDPITFTATLPDETESSYKQVPQCVLMKELNGQSFEVADDGRIEDNADPVLVINEAIYAYTLGRKWSLTYEAIDVCDSSVTVTRRFAMVNAANEDGLYPKPVTDEYTALTTSTVFMPTSDTQDENQYVSIYFELDDGTNLSGLDSAQKEAKRVYLWWYAADGQTEELSSAKAYECPQCGYRLNKDAYDKLEDDWTCPDPDQKEGHTEVKKDDLEEVDVEKFTYIIVNRGDVGAAEQTGEKSGPYYVGITANDETLQNDAAPEAAELAEKYQQAIDEVAFKKDDEGNLTSELALSAGDGSYFYLPSLRGLIASDNADYRNLRFSIYYKKQSLETTGSASSASTLRYNALRFEIDEEGKYIFKVLATDAAGNTMKYYVDEKLVTVSSDNIWDIEEIPTFEFRVTYTGATVEAPENPVDGYVNSTYSISSFDIVALDGYKTNYKLYYFDETKLTAGQSFDSFNQDVKGNFESYAACLREIQTFNSDISEDDTDLWNRTDNAYRWNPDSSLSFVPQDRGPCHYVVRLEVTEESRLPGNKALAYQVIEVLNPLDPLPDPGAWLENNIISVVFLSISAVLLVVIVILFVVKPSEKSVEEVDVSKLRGKKKEKKEKTNE